MESPLLTAVLAFLQYKFDPGTNIYDTSDKMRVPAWTDRVLVHAASTTKTSADILEYSAFIEGTQHVRSDHKPVYALIALRNEG